MPPRSIDEGLGRLDRIIADARRTDDPLGMLAERTAAARRALDDGATVRERDRRLFGTIVVESGRNG